jgi:hypothetical protein
VIRLLQLLFLGHVHKWKTLEKSPLKIWQDEVGKGPITGAGERYIQQCETCGKVIKRDLI